MTFGDQPLQPITFEIADGAGTVVLETFRAVVAGYTGRDREAVQRHIDELAEIGIPPPATVPAFFQIDTATVTQAKSIEVAGTNTSGEVEPVLVRCAGEFYLAVGSDHTDRDMERDDIARSKQTCPKPVSRQVVRLGPDAAGFDWDQVAATSMVDGVTYQSGTLRELRNPLEVLAEYDQLTGEHGDVLMFGGTLPLVDGQFVAGTAWDLALRLPDAIALKHSYSVVVADNQPPTQGGLHA